MGYLCTCLRLTNRSSRLRQVKARICRQYTRNVIKQHQVAGVVPDYLVARACCSVPFPSTFVPLFASTLSTFSGTLNVWPDLKPPHSTYHFRHHASRSPYSSRPAHPALQSEHQDIRKHAPRAAGAHVQSVAPATAFTSIHLFQ